MKQQVYQILNESYGDGCTTDDYDSRENLRDYCIETIQDHDELCQGCGVGPLMGYIDSWVKEFYSN